MEYVEAPNAYEGLPRPQVFLAGGISNCADWQQSVRAALQPLPTGTLINPRRAVFPAEDTNAAARQIIWEHKALWQAEIIAFWFTNDTLQPITLFELGTHLTRYYLKQLPLTYLIVGTEPGYARTVDVFVQVKLLCPQLYICPTLAEFSGTIAQRIHEFGPTAAE